MTSGGYTVFILSLGLSTFSLGEMRTLTLENSGYFASVITRYRIVYQILAYFRRTEKVHGDRVLYPVMLHVIVKTEK